MEAGLPLVEEILTPRRRTYLQARLIYSARQQLARGQVAPPSREHLAS